MIAPLPVLVMMAVFLVVLVVRQVMTYKRISLGRMLVTPVITLTSCAVAAYGISRGTDAAAWLILAGLGLSVAADSVLMIAEVDLMNVGLTFFLVTHILYLAAFCTVYSFRILDLVFAVILLVLMIYLLYRFRKGGSIGKMFIPVCVYVFALSVMVFFALGSAVSDTSVVTILRAAGAVLFYISDAVLGWSSYVKPIRRYTMIVWSFYAPGQLLIALSLVY